MWYVDIQHDAQAPYLYFVEVKSHLGLVWVTSWKSDAAISIANCLYDNQKRKGINRECVPIFSISLPHISVQHCWHI